MTFADLPSGAAIFIDANTWVYHYAAQPHLGPACTTLIRRIEQRDITGYTSTHILTEVAHRLMLVEASSMNGWPLAGTLKRLQKDASAVQKLVQFRLALYEILEGVREFRAYQGATVRSHLDGRSGGCNERVAGK